MDGERPTFDERTNDSAPIHQHVASGHLEPSATAIDSTEGVLGVKDTGGDVGPTDVKQEPDVDGFGNDWKFYSSEIIDLAYDEDNDAANEVAPAVTSPVSGPPRVLAQDDLDELASNVQATATEGDAMQDLDFGHSLLRPSQPLSKAPPPLSSIDKMKAAANDLKERMKKNSAAQSSTSYKSSFPEHHSAVQDFAGDVQMLDQDEPSQATYYEHVLPNAGAGSRGRAEESAAQVFKKLEDSFNEKKRAGMVSLQEEIVFIRIEADENARLRKLQADADFDRPPTPEISANPNTVFVSDSDDNVQQPPSLFHSDDESTPPKKGRKRRHTADNDDETLKEHQAPKKIGRPKGSKTSKAKKAMGSNENYDLDDLEHSLALGKRNAAASSKGKKREKVASAGAKAKAKPKSRKNAAPNMVDFATLMGTDVFADTERTANLCDQPGFDFTTKRETALKQLIASVPTDSVEIAKVDKRYLDEAIKAFTGQASVKPAEDGQWKVKGMKSTLKHYQILGTAFMRRRENSSHEPKGGILADQMGLGKTIMMLANIVNGRAQKSRKTRATLIVASPALVSQWFEEIGKHCERATKDHGIGRVIGYKAGSRLMMNDAAECLEEADIVLTTYHEVIKSYPKAIVPPNLVTSAQKDEWWKKFYDDERGMLHRIKFLRIVLDEAQAIKNHCSRTSLACRALEGKYRWAVTGTPVMNNIKEFYSYFKFLREPTTGTYKIFKENFCSPDDPDGSEKLNVFLRKFMIRRTHIDKLFDARLLDLPAPKELTVWLEFNEVERQIYEIVKKRFVQRINTLAKTGGLEKQYSHIWTMILRLRQITSHTLLAQGTISDLLEQEDFEKLNKITETEDEMSEEGALLILHLRNVLKHTRGVKTVESGLGGTNVTEVESLPNGTLDIMETEDQVGKKHGLSFRFRKYLTSLVESNQWSAITQRTLCSGCRQPPQNPQVTSCFHIYCQTCLHDLQQRAAILGHDCAKCTECGEAYNTSDACGDLSNFESTESARGSSEDENLSTRKAAKSKEGNIGDWIKLPGEVLPSAKTMAVKAQIMNWLEEESCVKTVIYTQFLAMVQILAKICETEGWGYCEYTGSMSHEKRDKAIKEFADKPEKNILLASLQSGGLGLNLTMASRVICIDPWWNAAVEQQAFCRIFRIGQQKETRMTRFVVKNTIDTAMMQMKERKQIEIDEVMHNSRHKDKPSVEDLMRLFGNVNLDTEGKPFIFAEGAGDDDEHQRLANNDSEDEKGMMGNEA